MARSSTITEEEQYLYERYKVFGFPTTISTKVSSTIPEIIQTSEINNLKEEKTNIISCSNNDIKNNNCQNGTITINQINYNKL